MTLSMDHISVELRVTVMFMELSTLDILVYQQETFTTTMFPVPYVLLALEAVF